MAKKPTLDEMRLALTKVMPTHQREANKAKFLESSKVKERLYHGTNKDIKSFKAPKNAVGIWATKNPDVANEYATISARGVGEPPSVYPVHVRLKNPANKDQFGDAWDLAAKDSSRLGWNTHDERHKKILQDQGFDGAILDDSVVVFDHKHIKSAIGNRGTYDINESDINKAKGGSVEPKKTVKAYKLFRVHEKHPGKLFPLFVDANTPVEMGKWVDAKIGEQSGEKVKSKIGPLAMRPGWHAGDLPVATHIGEKSHPKLTAPDTRPHNHAWAEVEMPNDVDWQTEANKRGMNKKGELISKHAHITDQLPVGGHYRYKTNPNMTGNWLIGGAMKVNRILSDAEVKKINDRHGVADLPRAEPFKKKTFGFASGGVVAPEAWVAEEHIHYTAPVHIKKKLDEMKAEMAQKVAHEKEYHKAIRHMSFDQIPTLEDWKKGQPTHAHHLEIEERPL